MNVLATIKKALPKDEVSHTKTRTGLDIRVVSTNRVEAKKNLETALKKQKIPFKSVFKRSKSSSMDILDLGGGVEIVFKPLTRRGMKGLEFEDELAEDLKKYFNGVEDDKAFLHPDVIKAIKKELKLTPRSPYEIDSKGRMNQKRKLIFDGRKVVITNSTGATLTDLTLTNGRKTIYLSLKTSKTYYVTSSSIYQHFLDKSTQVKVNEFFGFDGAKMSGFGKEYACVTAEPNFSKVKNNLAELLSNAIGTGLVLLHKKRTNDVMIAEVPPSSPVKVSITGLSEDSYTYPILGKRKGSNIKVKATVDGHSYIVNFQFRGTTAADTGPRYLRILMERL